MKKEKENEETLCINPLLASFTIPSFFLSFFFLLFSQMKRKKKKDVVPSSAAEKVGRQNEEAHEKNMRKI